MAVSYEELEGSPSLTLDRQGGSGKRVVRIAWSDIKRFALEIFPRGNLGFPYSASLTGYPWMRAQSMDVEPFIPDGMKGNGERINSYNAGAKVTVNYAPNSFEEGKKENTPGDKPGADELVFLENEIGISGEYLVWPNQGVRWQKSAATGNEIACGASGGYTREIQVSEEIRVGIIIPVMEHTITWSFVSVVPWTGIRLSLGKVNKNKWAGALPETLLFVGASASRQVSNLGTKMWKIAYKFQEKCINYPANKKVNGKLEEPIGWNHFFRPLGTQSRWERLWYGPNCDPIYPLTDFARIFKGN